MPDTVQVGGQSRADIGQSPGLGEWCEFGTGEKDL